MPDSPLRVRLTRIKQTDDKVLQSPLRFPCGPLEDFGHEEEGAHEEYDTPAGQFSRRRGGRQLRSSDFETMFLDWQAIWTDPEGDDPQRVNTELKGALRTGSPFTILVTHAEVVELHMDATIRSFGKRLPFGEPDTRYVSLSFKEWRLNTIDTRGHRKGDAEKSTTGESSGWGRGKGRHVLHPTDDLYNVALRLYGHYNGWKDIARANDLGSWGPRTPIVDHKDWKAGDILKIPKL